ncbi:hypothetical protein PQX77_009169 [Marasmius sp. AFHP31]|nr:hypothetical protein PQX77_009169 [Marasmius sp. AFHP31]
MPTFNLAHVFFVLSLLLASRAFEFNVSSPTACDDLTVSWTGGIPPFSLNFIELNYGNHNISIPNSSFSNNEGTFTTQLNLMRSSRFMVSMSDSTGLLSGGTSPVLTVGESIPGPLRCRTGIPPDFYFPHDFTIAQCQPYAFGKSFDSSNYAPPLTIFGFVPGGRDSFILRPPPFESFVWNVHLKAQTSVAFSIMDAQGRIGQTSDLLTVLPTSDSSCLSSPPQSSSSQSFSPITSPTAISPRPPKLIGGLRPADMAGTIIGAVASVGLIAFFGWWLGVCRRRSRFKRTGTDNRSRKSSLESNNIDLSQYDFSHTTQSSYPNEATGSRPPETSYDPAALVSTGNGSQDTSSTSPRPVIVHRDVNEDIAHPVELPPEYSESRPPIAGFSEQANDSSPPPPHKS